MNKERLEELASLHALNLLDEAAEKELIDAAEHDAEVPAVIRSFKEAAALQAYDSPHVAPPARLKEEIMRLLPAGKDDKIIRFPSWIPYAIAAALMALAVVQSMQIGDLKSHLENLQSNMVAKDTETSELRQTNAMQNLRLAILQEAAAAQADAKYSTSQVLVAWDPAHNRGTVSMRDLPAPPPGHDYQLWVLDPKVASPISAGLISGSRPFSVNPVATPNPGFAISLEPTGGMPVPTGPILFAFAPGK